MIIFLFSIFLLLFTERSSFLDIPPVYNSNFDYATTEAYFNLSVYARTLPPVPKECPTPLGVAGTIIFYSFIYLINSYN